MLNDLFARLLSGNTAPASQQGGLWTSNAFDNTILNKSFPAKITAESGGYYSWMEQMALSPATWVDKVGGRSGTYSTSPAYEANGQTAVIDSIVVMSRAYFDTTYNWVYVFEKPGTTTPASSSNVGVQNGTSGTGGYWPFLLAEYFPGTGWVTGSAIWVISGDNTINASTNGQYFNLVNQDATVNPSSAGLRAVYAQADPNTVIQGIVDGSALPTSTSNTTAQVPVGILKFDLSSGFWIGSVSGAVLEVRICAAGVSQAGVITTGTQSFAGSKTFKDDLIVGTLLGADTSATIFGSISLYPTSQDPTTYDGFSIGIGGAHNVLGVLTNFFTISTTVTGSDGIGAAQLDLVFDPLYQRIMLSGSNAKYSIVDGTSHEKDGVTGTFLDQGGNTITVIGGIITGLS